MTFGDRVFRYLPKNFKNTADEVLTLIVYAIGAKLDAFDEDFRLALAQASVLTAEGIWLEFWGFMLKYKKFASESDTAFRTRIISGIVNGSNTRKAILAAVAPHSTTDPVLTEYNGSTVVGDDYSTYDYDADFTKDAFIMKLQYTPPSNNSMTFYLGASYLGYNTAVFNTASSKFTASAVEQIVRDIKMAGVKVILAT